MTKVDEFRHYAEEAMRWARRSKTETDRAVLLDIARTWTAVAAFHQATDEKKAA